MYELKCPSCGHALKSPFVRIGAVVSCPACQHRYRIAPAHVTRKVQPIPSPRPGEPDPLLGGSPASGAGASEERPRVDKDGHVIGLSGLSEMMQREAAQQLAAQARSAAASGEGARQRAAIDPARQRRMQALFILAGAMGLLVAFLGAAIWYAQDTSEPALLAAPPPQQPPVAELPTPDLPDAQLPRIRALALAADPWHPPRQPLSSRAESAPLIWLTDFRMPPADHPHPVFTGQLATNRQGVVALAWVYLALMDVQGIEVAQTRVPVSLVGAGRRWPLSVPLPAQAHGRSLRMAWRIEVTDVMTRGLFLEGGEVRPMAGGDLRVEVANSAPRPLHRLAVVVMALDESNGLLGAWSCLWNPAGPIEPGRSVAFVADLPGTPPASVDHWRIEAAGE